MIKANVSDSGILNQTPSTPKCGGSKASPGNRKTSCLERESRIEMLTLPIDWKKLCNHNLCADDGKRHDADAKCQCCLFGQFMVGGKHSHKYTGE